MIMSDKQLQREKLLFQYTLALEAGDIEQVIQILNIAENDLELDRMIIELDAALLDNIKTVTPHQNNHANSLEDNPMIISTTANPSRTLQRRPFRIPSTLIAAILVTFIVGGLLFIIPSLPPVNFGGDGTPAIPQGVVTPEQEDLITRYISEVWDEGDTSNLDLFVTENHLLTSGNEVSIGIESLESAIETLHDVELDFSLATGAIEELETGEIQARVTLTFSIESLELGLELPDNMREFAFDIFFTMQLSDGLIAATDLDVDEESLQAALDSNPIFSILEINDIQLVNAFSLGTSDSVDMDEAEDGLTVPELPDCETDFTPGLIDNTFTVPSDDTEALSVLLYVPEGIFSAMEGIQSEDNILEARALYTGMMSFEVSDGDEGQRVQILQNNGCEGYTTASVDVALSPDVNLATQFIVTSGVLDADLRGLRVDSLEALVQSGGLNLILPDTESLSLADLRVTSGLLDVIVPDGATIDSMALFVASGTGSLIAESDTSFTADISVTSGIFSLEVSSETGLQVNLSGIGLANAINMPSDMSEVEDGVWQSDNFNSSEYQVIVNLNFTAGSIDIQH